MNPSTSPVNRMKKREREKGKDQHQRGGKGNIPKLIHSNTPKYRVGRESNRQRLLPFPFRLSSFEKRSFSFAGYLLFMIIEFGDLLLPFSTYDADSTNGEWNQNNMGVL
ncbi:hypothetical protein BDV41DRAFT_257617 [Aspergillus transmontanensis]|uniref:Uncharacterized protein n=1 Tax=Aspergillus transmontanensis TaxID=1034304 RepID=A0A5N6VYF2_9EURO|nr:hypothetical protein BDV41DRAFT_257617 [Aspergillus transmontanensis]